MAPFSMTTLNKREIEILQYSTIENWTKKLPRKNWLCILVDNDSQRNYIDEVISKLITNDVCYICTIGISCESTHDLVDEEIAFREADIDGYYLPKHFITTTWHHDFSEGLWFGIFAASSDEVNIERVIILDMTDGKELDRIHTLLSEFKFKN